MADKYIDIFKNLKSCHIKPPQSLFKKIWSTLTGKSNSVLHQPLPETTDFTGFERSSNEEYTVTEIEAFRALQNYIITPPPFSTLKIADNIASNVDKYSSKKNATVIGFKYFSKIAAAILIIGVGIWIAYSYKSHKKDEPGTAASTIPQKTAPVITNTDSVANNINNIKKTLSAKKDLLAETDKPRHAIKMTSIENAKHINAFKTYSSKNKLVDNDILLTLVSYNYTEYLPLLSEIKRNNKIKLDQFSYVTISEKMNNILKKMYALKRNNKPTHKAKRLKAKLVKWKKADEKHFDINTTNNPVDIIDLSEFILK